MSHVVILPYFCREEIDRYLAIAHRLKQFAPQESDYEFLLAASPKIEPNAKLQEAFSGIAPTTSFQCPSQVFGYPEGPTAMFWDCMDFIAKQMSGKPGFSLWLESDMAPVKEDWIDRLSEEWNRGPEPLLMGCYVPQVYKYRYLRRPKLLLDAHINGGACYNKLFARRISPQARQGVFDMSVYKYACKSGTARSTELIAFSTLNRVRRDVLDPNRVILHGFMQDKDAFINRCLAPVTSREQKVAAFNPIADRIERMRRRLRVCFVRRGKQAMLENMFLAKDKIRGFSSVSDGKAAEFQPSVQRAA